MQTRFLKPSWKSDLWWASRSRILLAILGIALSTLHTSSCAQDADLSVYSFDQFAPTILHPADHPTGLRFSLYNGGFATIDGPVDIELFLSRDNAFSEQDDISLGQITLDTTIPPGMPTNIIFDAFYPQDAAILANFTIPTDACGWYTNLYLKATAEGSSDPNTNNNVYGLGFIAHVLNQTGPAPTVQSITRLSPPEETTSAASVTWRVTFSDTVIGVGVEDFVLTLVSGSLGGTQITGIVPQSGTDYNVTANTGTGNGVLRLDVPGNASIYSLCEVRLSQPYNSSETYTVQRIGPTSIIVPSLTNGPVAGVDVVFSGPIDPTTFTYQDISLSHNGTNITLDGSVVTTLVSSNTAHISGLGTFTGPRGTYVISVLGAGITDLHGNPGAGTASATWNNSQLTVTSLFISNQTNGLVSSADAVFSAPIDSATFTYQDVNLTRNGTSIPLDATVTIVTISSTAYRISGLGTFTSSFGNYVISVNANTIIDLFDNAGNGTASCAWNNTPLTIAGVIVPAQTNGPVPAVDVVFSAPIDPASFTYQDVALSRDGIAVALDNAITTSLPAANTYRVNGLAGSTSIPGTYVITINATGITDTFGRPGTGSVSNRWKNVPYAITYTVLTPPGTIEAWAQAISGSQQVGYGNFGFDYPYVTNHAVLWSGLSGSFVDLNPPGARMSWAYATSGSYQAGGVEFGTTLHASLWTGRASPYVDLNPGGSSESVAYAASGSQQAGYAGILGRGHAAIWSGSPGSFVDLHPAVATDSFAYATTGSKQAGRVTIGGNLHAAAWSGTPGSFVDLNPAGASDSWAYAAAGIQQGGYATIAAQRHAALWSGTSTSFVDLGLGQVFAMAGSTQAGVAGSHAGFWTGTSNSFVDLGVALGTNGNGYAYGSSEAHGITISNRIIYVVGTALSYDTFRGYRNAAVLWTIRPIGPANLYVNRAYGGPTSDGSLEMPFKTVADGHHAAQTNDMLTIFSGNYNETIVMNKQLLLQATNGLVNIGRP